MAFERCIELGDWTEIGQIQEEPTARGRLDVERTSCYLQKSASRVQSCDYLEHAKSMLGPVRPAGKDVVILEQGNPALESLTTL